MHGKAKMTFDDTVGTGVSRVADRVQLSGQERSEESFRYPAPDQWRTSSLPIIIRASAAMVLAFTPSPTSIALPSPIISQTCAAVYHWDLRKQHQTQRGIRSKSFGDDDAEVDSPNWMRNQFNELKERGFRRINNPRAHTHN